MNDYNQPSVNTDGTPMINGAIDAKGKPFGVTDSSNADFSNIKNFSFSRWILMTIFYWVLIAVFSLVGTIFFI